MNRFNKISAITSALLVTYTLGQDITPPQLDVNSTFINSVEDNLGNLYTVFQNGSDVGDGGGAYHKRGQLLKYNGTSWETLNSFLGSASSDNGTWFLSAAEFRDSSMKFDSDNKLHLVYIDYDSDYDSPILAYQRYNSKSNAFNGWESQTSNAFFSDGIDGGSNYTPETTDIALDINSSDIPIIAYIDKADNKVHVRYLNDQGTQGTDTDITNFDDDTWDNLGIVNITSTEIDMTIDNDVPYLAYKENTNGKVSVLKYEAGIWTTLDANISIGAATNIDIYVADDENLYISYVDSGTTPVVAKLRRYVNASIDEESTETITQVTSTDTTNITYSLDGHDKSLFTISNDGNLSFTSAPSYENNIDHDTDGIYEVTVILTNSSTNLAVERHFNITLNDINDASTDIALSSTSVSQDAGSNAVVGILSATDVDTGDSATYTLVSGTGDTNNGFFNISGTSLRATDPSILTESSYSIRIQISDSGSATYQKVFSISVTDNVAPTVTTLTPTDNNAAASATNDIKIEFSEDIQIGTGNITIKKYSDDTDVEVFDIATSDKITIVDNILTINPTNNLDYNTQYYIEIAATAIEDISTASNSFAGITAKDDWDFTTRSDNNPDTFSFTALTNQLQNTLLESNTVTITGIENGIPISVVNGEYKIGAGAYTTAVGTIDINDTVTLRQTSSSSYSTKTTTSLTIGDTTVSFDVTTKSAPSTGGGGGYTPPVVVTPPVEPEPEPVDPEPTPEQDPVDPTEPETPTTPVEPDPVTPVVPTPVQPTPVQPTPEPENPVVVEPTPEPVEPIEPEPTPEPEPVEPETPADTTEVITDDGVFDEDTTSDDMDVIIVDAVTGEENTQTVNNTNTGVTLNSVIPTNNGYSVELQGENGEMSTQTIAFTDTSAVTKTVTDKGEQLQKLKTIGDTTISTKVEINNNGTTAVTFVSEDATTTTKKAAIVTMKTNVAITNNDDGSVDMEYGDDTTQVKAQISSRGETTHTVKTKDANGDDIQTQATSQYDGTVVSFLENGTVQTKATKTNADGSKIVISVDGTVDGKAIHLLKISQNGISKVSKATSNIQGAKTVISQEGEVQTSAGVIDDNNGYYITAEVVTRTDGTSRTRFVKVNKMDEDDKEILSNTLQTTTPYPAGNEVIIDTIEEKLYIKTTTSLDDTNLIVE